MLHLVNLQIWLLELHMQQIQHVSFDYVIEHSFTGANIYFPPGQDFGKGQAFAKAMDFSGGQMIFDIGTEFTEIQDFDEAGTFSGTLDALVCKKLQLTTEWADIFDDIGSGVDSIPGFDHTGNTATDYVTAKIIYADFTATTAGSQFQRHFI